MARRKFATVDAVLIAICVVIFAGGVLAQTGAAFTPAQPPAISLAGDRS